MDHLHNAPRVTTGRRPALVGAMSGAMALLLGREAEPAVAKKQRKKKRGPSCPTCATCPPPDTCPTCATCPPPDTCPARSCCNCTSGCHLGPPASTSAHAFAQCEDICGGPGTVENYGQTLAGETWACGADGTGEECLRMRCPH